MTTTTDVYTGLKTALENGISDLRIYPRQPDVINELPGGMLTPRRRGRRRKTISTTPGATALPLLLRQTVRLVAQYKVRSCVKVRPPPVALLVLVILP